MDAHDDRKQVVVNSSKTEAIANERLRALAYSMDALIPGLYVWLGNLRLRLGGSLPEPNYPGTIHSFAGIAVVLPGYRIYSTYHGSYDP